MKLKTVSSAIAALALVSTPVLAQSSVAERVSAPVSENEELSGSGLIIAIVAAAAVIGGIIILADDDDQPTSP